MIKAENDLILFSFNYIGAELIKAFSLHSGFLEGLDLSKQDKADVLSGHWVELTEADRNNWEYTICESFPDNEKVSRDEFINQIEVLHECTIESLPNEIIFYHE